MHEYHLARQIKLPDAVPASAGGQVKTSMLPCLVSFTSIDVLLFFTLLTLLV